MRTIALDTEYDYLSPFLATTTDEELQTKVYRLRVLSQKKALKLVCESRQIRKVFHHATGDIFQLRNIGIKVADPVECTLIASNLVDENYSSRRLKTLVKVHLGIETKEANRLKSTIKKYKKKAEKEGIQFKWSQIPEDVMIPYARRDPEYTIKLWYYWQTPIEESRKLYEFEKTLIPLIVDIQTRGMRIDRYMCRRFGYEYGKKLESLYEDMSRYLVDRKVDLGKEFNPRSVPQLQNIILQLEAEYDRDKKTWTPKTDKKALQKLALLQDSAFFKMVMLNRFYTKHKSVYYDPLYEYYTSERSDIAHFLMYQTGAKTGRFSMELIQTFPRPEESASVGQKHEVRKAVIPKKGKYFLCKDYEQQEMRLFIHYANCERMIDIINKKGGRGIDCYVETAELMFGDMFQNPKYRKPLRFVTKHDSLGMIYGEGVNKLVSSTGILLAERFGKEIIDEIGVTDQWAYDVIQKYYELYPVREFMNEKIKELYGQGYIELKFNSRLMDFTRRYNIPKAFAYRSANACIQGTAAYIIKHAMIRVQKRIEREGWENKVEMIMQVHDELIFEVDNDLDVRHVDTVLGEEMEDHETFRVPITTSGKWSRTSWGDVVDL